MGSGAGDCSVVLSVKNKFGTHCFTVPAAINVHFDAGRFVMCKDNDLTKARAIFMIINGRVRLAQLDNNGTPLDGSGTPITACL